jgi:AraC-like DNA-binding protein
MSEIRHVAFAPTETRHLARGDDVTPHRHDDHQLIYASSGVLEVFVHEGTWFTPAVRAVLVPAGREHHWRVHGTTTVHLIGISTALTRLSDESPLLVSVDRLGRELMIACSVGGPPQSPAERRLLRVLIDRLQPAAAATTMLPTFHDERLRKAQALVETDMSATPALAELGRAVGASERTLSRLFRDDAGMPYTVWRTQLRLRSATLMLAEGSTVTQAAAACGWSSPSAFVTSFRTAFGRTPGSLYRRLPD